MTQNEAPRLSRIQRLSLNLFQITPTEKKTRPGWRGFLQFYAFECPEHDIVEDYFHGYRKVLRCPECRGTRHNIDHRYLLYSKNSQILPLRDHLRGLRLGNKMSFTEKIDVLDLLINILREHEEKLDSLVDRLEVVSKTIQRDPTLKKSLMEYEVGKTATDEQPGVSTILVVDDDKNLANTFKLILQSVGFEVDTAATGLQALYKANRTKFDLIILDMNLPDMLGDEVAEKLKDQDQDINIIMITGYSSFKEGLEGNDLGIDEILMKPIPPEDLVKITKKTLTKEQ